MSPFQNFLSIAALFTLIACPALQKHAKAAHVTVWHVFDTLAFLAHLRCHQELMAPKCIFLGEVKKNTGPETLIYAHISNIPMCEWKLTRRERT